MTIIINLAIPRAITPRCPKAWPQYRGERLLPLVQRPDDVGLGPTPVEPHVVAHGVSFELASAAR